MKMCRYLIITISMMVFPCFADWIEKPGMQWNAIVNLAVGDRNNIWSMALILPKGEQLYKWENGQWAGLQGELPKAKIGLSISQDNKAYVVTARLVPKRESAIYEFGGGTWNLIHTFDATIWSFSVINKDNIWVAKRLSPNNFRVFHWNGSSWEQKSDENIWEVYPGNDGTIIGWRMTFYVDGKKVPPSDWVQAPEDAKVSDKADIVAWNGTNWELLSHAHAVSSVAVVNKNNIWIVKGEFFRETYPYKWDLVSKEWIQRGNMPARQIVAGRDGTIFMLGWDDKIYEWIEE